jgi:dTDP-glucose 4,6-dehydratase
VVVLDKLTYAANARAVEQLGVPLVRADIADRDAVRDLLVRERPDAIVHLAAESHVDRSIDAPAAFLATNVVGTFALLEEVRRYVDGTAPAGFRFLHVSTDEVFGALGPTGVFDERSRYAPRSPYAASKAGADHLVAAYTHTYGIPAITTNCSNNYGPHQFPEKLIPLVIMRALAGEEVPVYARGENVRDWIYVADHCAALRAVLERGQIGDSYLIGARSERRNIDVVHAICAVLDALRPRREPHSALIRFVTDRPGHDFRYAIDPSRIERELGWRPTVSFEDGLARTVRWYVQDDASAASVSRTPG